MTGSPGCRCASSACASGRADGSGATATPITLPRHNSTARMALARHHRGSGRCTASAISAASSSTAGKHVADQLGLRQREEADHHQRPHQHQQADRMLGRIGGRRSTAPGEQPGRSGQAEHEQRRREEPERLRVVEAAGGITLEVLHDDEVVQEPGVAHVHGHEPGQRDGEQQREAGEADQRAQAESACHVSSSHAPITSAGSSTPISPLASRPTQQPGTPHAVRPGRARPDPRTAPRAPTARW